MPQGVNSGNRDAIVADYIRGVKIADIRARYSYSNPRNVAAAYGLPPRRPKKFTPEQEDAIVAAYARGDKLEVIREEHGCSTSFASRLAKRRGLPRRTRETIQ